MKKLVLLALFTIFTVVITSCTNNGRTSNSMDTNESKESINIESGDSPSVIENEVKKPQDLNSLIPKGWQILERFGEQEKVQGDLNKDGIRDIALVIEETDKKEDEAPNRSLLIAFGNEDGGYNLSIIAKTAILKADEGGVWGDPLESISVDRGSLLVKFYGGSNWRWYGIYRFRYQDNDWYLIGATTGSFHTATDENTEESDYNLLTGDFIQKKADETGKINTIKGNRGKSELLKLEDFVANGSEEQYLN